VVAAPDRKRLGVRLVFGRLDLSDLIATILVDTANVAASMTPVCKVLI